MGVAFPRALWNGRLRCSGLRTCGTCGAEWLFLRRENRPLQGEGGFGDSCGWVWGTCGGWLGFWGCGLWQRGLLAASRCWLSCPWPSCPASHFVPLETTPPLAVVTTAGLGSNQSELWEHQQTVPALEIFSWLGDCPGRPVPMPDHPFQEGIFPNVQSKTAVVQFEAILIPSPIPWEQSPTPPAVPSCQVQEMQQSPQTSEYKSPFPIVVGTVLRKKPYCLT